MVSDAKLPQCAAVDGCDSYGHPLRCESVATSQQTGLCDRHTTCERSPLAEEINALPERLRSWIHHLETDADPAGTLRENFVLREAVAALGAKVDKAEAQRDRLAQHIEWANREYAGEHESVDAEIASLGECVPDVVYSMAKLGDSLRLALETSRRRGVMLKKAEAQRDRLAEVLRTAVELSHSYDSDNVACWDMVWASADDALADIEKEAP